MKPASLALLASILVAVAAHGEPIVDALGSYVDPTAEDIQVAVDEYLAALDKYGSAEVWPMGWFEHVLLKKSDNARDRKTLKPIFDDEKAFYGAVRSISGRKGMFSVPDLIFTEALFKPGFFAEYPKCIEPSDDYNDLGPSNSGMSYFLWRRFDIDKSTYDPAAVNRGFYDPKFTLELGDKMRLLNPAAYDQLGFLKAAYREEHEEIEKGIVAFIKDYEYPTEQEVVKLIAQQRKASERRRISRERRRGFDERRRLRGGFRTARVPSGTDIDADAADATPRWPLVGAVVFLVLNIAWWLYSRRHSTTHDHNP